jgi:hypothetical protein
MGKEKGEALVVCMCAIVLCALTFFGLLLLASALRLTG